MVTATVEGLTMEELHTDSAPVNDFPYAQGIVHADTIYVAGQLPIDPETGDIIGDTIRDQTRRAMDNIAAVLEAGGRSPGDIVKTTGYLADLDDFDGFNEAYRAYLTPPFPARSVVEVGALAAGALVEIDVIATY